MAIASFGVGALDDERMGASMATGAGGAGGTVTAAQIVEAAMAQLHWTKRDLFLAALPQHGALGPERDLVQYLGGQRALSPNVVVVLADTLNEALRTQDVPFRLG